MKIYLVTRDVLRENGVTCQLYDPWSKLEEAQEYVVKRLKAYGHTRYHIVEKKIDNQPIWIYLVGDAEIKLGAPQIDEPHWKITEMKVKKL